MNSELYLQKWQRWCRGFVENENEWCENYWQDEELSVVYEIPKVAYEIGAVEKKVPLIKIYDVLWEMLNN